MARIAFASWEIDPTTPGGCGVLLANAAQILLRQGHDVLLLLDVPAWVFRKFDTVDRLAFPGPGALRAYHVESLADTGGLSEEDFADRFAWKAFLFERAARRLCELESPDVLEFFEYCGVGHAALSSKAAGRAFGGTHLAVRLHNSIELIDAQEATLAHRSDRYGLFGLEHAALRLAETVLFPSSLYLEECVRPRYGAWLGRTALSPSPLDRVPELEPSAPNADTALFFGRLFTFKGPDLFVDAGIRLLESGEEPPLRFVLAGYDPGESPVPGLGYEAYLRRRIPGGLQDRFEFVGQLDRARLRELSKRVRLAVFPSRLESFCYAAQELSQAGVPVVVSDIPLFRDFFTDEVDALFAKLTAADLARQVSRLNRDEALRKRLGSARRAMPTPLGEFYGAPGHPSWIRPAPEGGSEAAPGPSRPSLLVLVLDDGGAAGDPAPAGTGDPAEAPESLVVARPAGPAPRLGAAFLFGRAWELKDRSGAPLSPDAVRTKEAILVLRSGDRCEPGYLSSALDTLRLQPQIGFVGAFRSIRGGERGADTLSRDAAGETVPFRGASVLSRAVLRTTPGLLLSELFDGRAARLAEVRCLWALESAGLVGLTVPELLVSSLPEPPEPFDEVATAFLVIEDTDPERKERLARAAVVQRTGAGWSSAAGRASRPWPGRLAAFLSERGPAGERALALLRAARRRASRLSRRDPGEREAG